jgi:hypothetical protein
MLDRDCPKDWPRDSRNSGRSDATISPVEIITVDVDAPRPLDAIRARLSQLEQRVQLAVMQARAKDPEPDDPYRGLYISDEHIDLLLEADPAPSSILAPVGLPSKDGLHGLARAFELDNMDVELLVIAAAPDLDSRFERFYGYLQDDVTRRRAGIELALKLCGLSPLSASARRRVLSGPLIEAGLLRVEDLERPFLTRSLRVPDRVTAHLLGDETPHRVLAELISPVSAWDSGTAPELTRALRQGYPCYVLESVDGLGAGLGTAALESLGIPALTLDLRQLGEADPQEIAVVAGREATMTGAGLVAGPIDSLAGNNGAVARFASLQSPLVLFGRRTWDPTWSHQMPVAFSETLSSAKITAALWRDHLDGHCRQGVDPAATTVHFRLGPEQIKRSALMARRRARLEERAVEEADLRDAARVQNSAGLERLARRIVPEVNWDDLILPSEATEQLRELTDRARLSSLVLDEWGMQRGSRGEGITALFAGPSGTGKTMAAEVLTAELGFDLYAVDIATVVDKYIGETEKNLDRIFSEAAGVNGVLFFDEADALFGKRSDVRDSHDRYANVEVAYLLQRMEQYDGLAILATNLRANLDDAFTRRLQAVVEFPMPDAEHRLRIWEQCLGPRVPRASDLDLDFCARSFELSGGNIRNITLAAAVLAARAGQQIAMAHIIRSIEREYRKLGRLCTEREFGKYFSMVAP